MGNRERRERIQALRKADILAAARKIFAEKGYEAATMDDIAACAEYTKRTLYSYFPSKHDLLLALMESGLKLMVETYEKVSDPLLTGAERISHIGDSCVDLFRNHPHHFTLFTLNTSLLPDLIHLERYQNVRKLNGRIHEIIADAFAAGVRDGSVRAGTDSRVAALFVTSVAIGLIHQIIQSGSTFQEIYGMSSDDFLAICKKMIGASFLSGKKDAGTGMSEE